MRLEAPELDQFPKITLYLNIYDALGNFVPGMDLNAFKVFEDGFERTVNEVMQLEPGLHTIIALNLGATLSNRSSTSVPTRYEETIFALASWLNGLQSQAANQYSLASNEGILVENAQEKTSFTNILQNYKPNLFNFQPDLTALNRALDVAAKPNLIAQSKQAILYITPLPLDQDLEKLAALQARAVEIGVPMHVWLIAPETASNAPAQQFLNRLAVATGGKYLFFVENSISPNPEDYVGALRSVYRLRYTSAINQSGTHSVRVAARHGNLSAETDERQFSINLNMPTATLINLPKEIKREYADNPSGSGKILQPGVVTLQAAITFPDGFERQLKATRLYADGELIAENLEEPYDYFGWQLENYRFSGEHLVAVEVEDILGFRNISPPVAINITVASLYPGWLTSLLRFVNQGGWIPLSLAGFGASLLVGIRLRKRLVLMKELRASPEYAAGGLDPTQQSIPGLDASMDEYLYPATARTAASELDLKDSAPRLVLVDKGLPACPQEIILLEKETIFGSDAGQVNAYLEHSSISPQHSLLLKNERGSVSVADLGSEAGTWVNYAPVSSAGVLLYDGDLLQIGKVTYQYRIGRIR